VSNTTANRRYNGRNWQLDIPDATAYWIDRILFDVQHKRPDFERFVADRLAYMEGMPLPAVARDALRDDDFGQMYLCGANPYLIRAHCLALRVSEEQFLASLRAVGATHG
jgi:hypothetical protein